MTDEQISYMKQACLLCDRATCKYKTGCVCVKNGKIVAEGWNETLRGEIYCQDGSCIRQEQKLEGGKNIDMVCSIHAESAMVATASAQGKNISESDVYVTTFPCYICSKLLAKARILNLFYMSDYMGGNKGKVILEEAGIKIMQIPEKVLWN